MPLSQRAKNVATSYIQLSVALVAAVVTSRAIVDSLGVSGYGVWALLQTLAALAALLVGGLSSALLRYMARFLGKGDPEAALQVARTGLSLLRRAVVLSLVAGVLAYALVLPGLRIPESMLDSARVCWLLVLAAALLEIRTMSPKVTLAALQRHDLRNWAQSAVVVLQTVLVVAAMELGHGLPSLGALRLVAFALLLLSWEAFARSIFPVPYRLGHGERFDQGELLRFTGATTVIFLSGTIVYSMDAVVVSAVAGASVVAFYTPAARLAESVRTMVYSFVNVVVPRANELHATGATDAFEHLLSRGSRICGFLIGPFIAAGIVCGDQLLTAWLGSEFRTAHPILIALLIQVFFLGGTSVLEGGLIAVGAAAPLARAHAAFALLNLALSVWWIHTLGLIGPAVATAVTGSMMGGLMLPVIYGRFLERPIAFVYRNLARSFLGLLPTAAMIAAFARPRLEGAGLADVVVVSAPIIALGFLANAAIVLNGGDRQYLLSLLRR
ncbi:MAG: hypothetical protein BMS9Abin37_0568 [Acidobacteriota bacterium]|nr:MAG: hypothetical protein BMS9Abin37_0568 [Acidobacteriota bacterium]